MIRTYLELCKVNLSFFSTLSAVTGFMLARPDSSMKLLPLAGGIFLLACGASALNQYQDRVIDSRMERTKRRPVPSLRIKPAHALYFSLLLLFAGSSVLSIGCGTAVILSGLSAVVLYNGVYTYLKRKTAFASVPCAVIGMIPPLAGWLAAGGDFPDRRIIALCFLFYLWQVTHFWLLFLAHGEDYRKARLPSLTQFFTETQLRRIVFVWVLATATASVLLIFYGLMKSLVVTIVLFAAITRLIHKFAGLIRNSGDYMSYHVVFQKMNLYLVLIMCLLTVEMMMG